MIKRLIFKYYAYIFARTFFIKLNKFLYQLSLRGLGVLNYENHHLTGEKRWLKNFLRDLEDPIIIDVGANVGDYLSAIYNANYNSTTYAFEPHPKTFEALKKNIKKFTNGSVNIFNLGVGDKNETIELHDYADNNGSQHASLYKEVITDLHKGNIISHNVDIVKLDDFLENQLEGTDIDLLKIDTEGNEFKVLLGAKKLLKSNKIKVIHLEFNDMNIISGTTFKHFWDLLSNYNFFRILPGGRLYEIKNYSPILCEIYAFQNIVAILKKDANATKTKRL